ncbi:hypothetical protein GB937_009948 [Aspergillus fischeri]|nr:hypothetical protein GB937_009948 [Aspergillus fischeri]
MGQQGVPLSNSIYVLLLSSSKYLVVTESRGAASAMRPASFPETSRSQCTSSVGLAQSAISEIIVSPRGPDVSNRGYTDVSVQVSASASVPVLSTDRHPICKGTARTANVRQFQLSKIQADYSWATGPSKGTLCLRPLRRIGGPDALARAKGL